MVGHLIRHHPVFAHMLKMVNAEKSAVAAYPSIAAGAGAVRDTESVLFDLCPHDLALVAALTNRPSRACSVSGAEPYHPGY